MEFYLIFSSILPPVYPLGKENRLAGRREAASKKNYLFTRVRWNLLHFPLINPGRPRVCQTILRSGVPQGRGVGCIHRCPTPPLCKSSNPQIWNPHPRRSVHQRSLILILLIGYHPLLRRLRRASTLHNILIVEYNNMDLPKVIINSSYTLHDQIGRASCKV